MKKNKNVIKILFLLSMCILGLLIYKIIDIYAVFQSEVKADIQIKNGIWNIIINGEKISTGVQKDFIIDQITLNKNDYTKPGKIAPGLSGSFEVEINPENTNVSVRYDITLDKEGLKNSNLRISKVEEVKKATELVETSENTYTGIIPLQDIQKGINHKIRVEVEWVDDGQNNKSDTELGTSDILQLKIPVKFHATQYLGEEIIQEK